MRMLTPALGLNPGYLLLVLVNQPRAPWNSSAGSLNAVSRVVSKSLLTDSGRLQQCHAGAGTWGQGPGNALPFFFVLLCWRFEAEVQLWIQPGWQRMRGWCWKWQLVCALCSSRWTRGPMAAPSEQWQIKPHSSLKASNHNSLQCDLPLSWWNIEIYVMAFCKQMCFKQCVCSSFRNWLKIIDVYSN